MADSDLARQVGARLSRESGLLLTAERLSSDGYDGWGLFYSSQAEQGLTFSILLSSSLRRAEAVFRPSRFAGPLVRSMSRHLATSSDEWQRQLEIVDRQGVTVTVVADSELVSNVARVGEREFRQIEIECVARHPQESDDPRLDGTVLVARSVLALVLAGLELSAKVDEEELEEGARIRVEVNKYERNPIARMRCIEHYGDRCWVCDLSFAESYGALGDGYIHVHHRVLVSAMKGKQYTVDPIRDLVPLCPNCHAMVHRRSPPFEPAELRELMGRDSKEPLPPVSR